MFAAVVLTAVVAAAAWVMTRTVQHEAVARVLVSPLDQSDRAFLGVQVIRESPNDPTRTMQTAGAILQSRPAAALAARNLGRGWTPDAVASAVSVQTEGESNILAVRAKADDADEAVRVANAFTRAALRVRGETVKLQAARVIPRLKAQQRSLGDSSTSAQAADVAARINQLQTAQYDGDPTLSLEEPAYGATALGPSRSLVLILSLVAGLAVAAATAILLELTARRLRDADEATALFPLPVLARVPVIMPSSRTRLSGALTFDQRMHEVFRTVFLQLEEEGADGRTVMLTSASAGDGTTTSAIYLALTMAVAGHDVILLDCDVRYPEVHRMLALDGSPRSLADAPNAALDDLFVQVSDLRLWVMSVGPAPSTVDAMRLVARVPDLVADARERADFVVIDTAPLGEVGDAIPLLREVDDILIVTRPRHTERASYEVMRDLVMRSGVHARGLLVIGDSRAVSYPDSRADVARGALASSERLKRVLER